MVAPLHVSVKANTAVIYYDKLFSITGVKCIVCTCNLSNWIVGHQKALIYVGGGITETSNPEKEWEETVSKSLVIKSVL